MAAEHTGGAPASPRDPPHDDAATSDGMAGSGGSAHATSSASSNVSLSGSGSGRGSGSGGVAYHSRDFDHSELLVRGAAWEAAMDEHWAAAGDTRTDADADADADARGDSTAGSGAGAEDAGMGDTGDTGGTAPLTAAWDAFHSTHSSGRVYKPRRFLLAEFPCLRDLGTTIAGSSSRSRSSGAADHATAPPAPVVLEVGCGSGSNVLPLLQHTRAEVVAVDLSDKAIQSLRAQGAFKPHASRCRTATCNLGHDPLPVPPASVDAVCCLFVLSAVHPTEHARVAAAMYACLRDGGLLCFRDYGLYDLTQLRQPPANAVRLATDTDGASGVRHRCFRRPDGTLTYYFSVDDVTALFTAAGFAVREAEYATIRATNRRNGRVMDRCWVHAVVEKVPGAP